MGHLLCISAWFADRIVMCFHLWPSPAYVTKHQHGASFRLCHPGRKVCQADSQHPVMFSIFIFFCNTLLSLFHPVWTNMESAFHIFFPFSAMVCSMYCSVQSTVCRFHCVVESFGGWSHHWGLKSPCVIRPWVPENAKHKSPLRLYTKTNST